MKTLSILMIIISMVCMSFTNQDEKTKNHRNVKKINQTVSLSQDEITNLNVLFSECDENRKKLKEGNSNDEERKQLIKRQKELQIEIKTIIDNAKK